MLAQDNVLLCREVPESVDVVGPSWEHFVFIEKRLVEKLMWQTSPRSLPLKFALRAQAMWNTVAPGREADRRPRNILSA